MDFSELETAAVSGGEEVIVVAVYTIIRVYEMPGDSLQEATERMSEALVLHVERDFHVKDIVRAPGAKEV